MDDEDKEIAQQSEYVYRTETLKQELLFAQYIANKQEGRYNIAKALLADRIMKTDPNIETIYVYRNGVFVPEGEMVVRLEAENILGSRASQHDVNEILGHVRRLTYEKNDHKPATQFICLQDCVLNFETLEEYDHRPEYGFYTKIPVVYDPRADCPKIKQFLSEVLNPDDIIIAQEMFGYVLYREMPMHKAVMLVGEGSNGKSTFLNIFKLFLGHDNLANIPLQALSDDKFSIASLKDKHANLFSDLSADALKDTGWFKVLTGGDYASVDIKFAKQRIGFENYAKFIFSANKIPLSYDDTDAYFRRWIIISFPNQFTGTTAKKNLIKELTTDQELSGLLNWAIEGLRRLQANEWEYSFSKATKDIREEYIRKSDPMGAFFMDHIIENAEKWVVKKDLYQFFRAYCVSQKYPLRAPEYFFRKINKYCSAETQRMSIGDDDKKLWVLVGIEYVEEKKDTKNEDF